MYSLLMSSIAQSVVALEVDSAIYANSLYWKNFFESKGYAFSNVEIINKDVSHCVSVNYDALLLTLVLYHLTDEEIDLLMDDAKHQCDRIIIQCRPTRILAKEKGSLVGHVSSMIGLMAFSI